VDAVSPISVADVLARLVEEAQARQARRFRPFPTGFVPLDELLGGGLHNGDLTLIGGPQGVGKTILTLQIARNIAMAGTVALYICYEHTRAHLLQRLLCLESYDPNASTGQRGLTLAELNALISRPEEVNHQDDSNILDSLLAHPQASRALGRIQQYADRLMLIKAGLITDLDAISKVTNELHQRYNSRVILFVDYLQKVPAQGERAGDEAARTTVVAEGLKDIAMQLHIPVVAIAAADRPGLKVPRVRVYDLRGSSALQYESDVVIMLNNKYRIVSKSHVTYNPHKAQAYRGYIVLSLEKNRNGPADVNLEFAFHPAFFRLDTVGGVVREQLIGERGVEE